MSCSGFVCSTVFVCCCKPTLKWHQRFLFRSPLCLPFSISFILCDCSEFLLVPEFPGVFLEPPPLSSSQNWDFTGYQRNIIRSHARPGISPSRLHSLTGESKDILFSLILFDVSFLRTRESRHKWVSSRYIFYLSHRNSVLTRCLPRSRRKNRDVDALLPSSLYCVS